MSSLFARSTKSLVRELGRKGELLPVDSLNSSPRLHPFCLVRKKHKLHPWSWDTPFIPTDFSLLDVLEPGSPVPEVSRSEPIHIREKVTAAVTGAMSLSTGLQEKVMGSGMVTHSSTLALQTLRVSPHTWETLVEKRKLRMPRPSFLRELQSRKERESLYVVTEAMETLQDTTLQSLSKVEGAGQLSFLGPSHFKGQCQSHVAKEKTVIVPRGSVLAYRVLQLVIKEDHWGKAPGEEPDFLGLQRWAGAQLHDLATLPPDLRYSLLGALQELLRDPQALQELEDMLEQTLYTGLLAQLEGPGGSILSTLRDLCGNLSPSRVRALLCLLGALVGAPLLQFGSHGVLRAARQSVLSDTQHCLLAESLGRCILAQQLELVASILEGNFNQMEETAVSLRQDVLSSLQSEDAALTLSLVQSCELEQGPSLQLVWDPEALLQLSALCGALAGLQLLACPGPRPSRLMPEEGAQC
ncbi:gasdermin-A-like [Loxodonta africana]|uniref:gasdermin-A-like n=1 Tax=Loxodonta africana TaxID=9785 RepID=UPI0030D43E26